MNSVCQKLWREEDGVLSFEWVLIITLLVIGIVSGLAATRDAIIDEMGDVSGAALGMDQGYRVQAVQDEEGNTLASGFSFSDQFPTVTRSRSTAPKGQTN